MGVAPLESGAGSAASAGALEASKHSAANNALAASSNRIEHLPARRKTPTAILRHLVLRLGATNGRRWVRRNASKDARLLFPCDSPTTSMAYLTWPRCRIIDA